jgi:hypothetical protein
MDWPSEGHVIIGVDEEEPAEGEGGFELTKEAVDDESREDSLPFHLGSEVERMVIVYRGGERGM